MARSYAEQAYELAEKAHKGQKRWGGEDYFKTHVLGVRDIVLQQAREDNEDREMRLIALESVALLHDTIEDAKTELHRIHVRELIQRHFPDYIWKAVDAITKNPGEQYVDYLERVKDNDIARLVKIADLTHNMSDLKEGQRKAKYSLALYILRH